MFDKYIRYTLPSLFFICSLFILQSSYAIDDTSLYQARVAIEARDIKTRNQGFLKGIKQVLQKLSGQQTLPTNISKNLKNPEQWVQQFSYETLDETNYLLLIDFDRIAVDALMKKLQLPVWTGKRPTLLAWISLIEEGQQEKIITPEEAPSYAKLITDIANNAGFTILMPVLDLADRQLAPQHIYTGKSEVLTELQQRYGVEAIVSAQIKPVNDTWAATWHFKHMTQLSWQATKDKNVTTFIETGVQRALQRLRPQTAVKTPSTLQEIEKAHQPSLSHLNKLAENHIKIKIKGINSLAHYQMIQQQLNRVSTFKTVNLYDLQAEHAIFSIEVEGGINALKQALSSLGQLTLQNNENNASPLTYYFNP